MAARDLTRRGFLKETAILGAAAAAMRAADGAAAPASPAPTEKGKPPAGGSAIKLPTIKLGKLEVSRLLLGSNPFWGYAHRDGGLGKKMRDYFTDERIVEVLEAAAEQGITTVVSPPEKRWVTLFNRYLKKGGKLRIWIAQPHNKPEVFKEEITFAAKGGAKGMFVQGARADAQFARGEEGLKTLTEWLKHIRSFGVAAGIASHRPDTHPVYEKRKLPVDFFFQCFFQPDKYLSAHRDEAVATLKKLRKPVVGYKVLAAGRLPAKEAFAFAFRHLRAKDGVCVGIYPPEKPDMIEEDAGLTRKLSKPPEAKKA